MPPWISSRIVWGLEGRWRYGLAGLALLLLLTLGAVGSVLADMHLPGSPGASPTAIASPATDVARAAELIRVWDDWDAAAAAGDAAGGARSGPWVAWWLIVDCVFAVVLGLLVGFTGWARRRKLVAPPPDPGGAQAAVLALLWLVPAMAGCYVVFDLVEDLLTGVAVASEANARGTALGAVRVLSGGKWLALTAAVLPLAASYAVFRARDREGRRAILATAMELRPQVVASGLAVSALVLLPANVRTQVHDLMLGWLDDAGTAEAFAAVVVVAVLAAAVWVTGVSALHFAGEELTASPLSTRRAWAVGIAGAALVGLGFVLKEVDAVEAGWVAWVPGGMALAWALLSIPDPVREVENVRPPLTARPGVLRVLAVLPPFGLLVAWLRAVIPVFDPVLAGVSAAGLVVLAVAWVGLWRATPGSGRVLRPRALLAFGAVLAATGAAPVAAAAASPQGMAPAVGGVALVLLGAEVVLGALIVFDSLVAGPPRGPLALVGFRRFPIILAVVLTAVTVSVLARTPGFHEARVEPRPGLGAARDPLSVASALEAWQAAPGPPPAGAAGGGAGERPWRPLFVLSTAGGGGRAAYWTLLALNCLFADAPVVSGEGCGGGMAQVPSMFAASGISGGSVGLAMFSADPGLDPDDVFADGFVDQV
ncbi:MAG TPA: hypothetical protein VFO65_12550, partial [Acidimicrobiales bacterium]|nr:hypothetical protein [Acidimicrobiales bacterium]